MKAGENPYVVELVTEHPINKRRGLAFLICKNDSDIDAKSVFDGLRENIYERVSTSFDYWLDGLVQPKRFHGFDEPKNRDCFVFKWNDGQQRHRFYGFLCHPLQERYPNFRLCVLVSHATKNEKKTNPTELKRMNELKINEAVKEAIAEATKGLNPDKTK